MGDVEGEIDQRRKGRRTAGTSVPPYGSPLPTTDERARVVDAIRVDADGRRVSRQRRGSRSGAASVVL